MDEDKKQKVKLGLIVGCLVLAAGIFLMTRPKSSGSRGSAKGDIQMLCVNEACNAEYEMTRDEFREQMKAKGPGAMMMPGMGPQAFTCIDCGEESAFMAMKCPSCSFVFIQDFGSSDDYADRCPECDYSAIEERRNK